MALTALDVQAIILTPNFRLNDPVNINKLFSYADFLVSRPLFLENRDYTTNVTDLTHLTNVTLSIQKRVSDLSIAFYTGKSTIIMNDSYLFPIFLKILKPNENSFATQLIKSRMTTGDSLFSQFVQTALVVSAVVASAGVAEVALAAPVATTGSIAGVTLTETAPAALGTIGLEATSSAGIIGGLGSLGSIAPEVLTAAALTTQLAPVATDTTLLSVAHDAAAFVAEAGTAAVAARVTSELNNIVNPQPDQPQVTTEGPTEQNFIKQNKEPFIIGAAVGGLFILWELLS